jgi:hypothetical protein
MPGLQDIYYERVGNVYNIKNNIQFRCGQIYDVIKMLFFFLTDAGNKLLVFKDSESESIGMFIPRLMPPDIAS